MAELIPATRISRRLQNDMIVHGVLQYFEITSSKFLDRGQLVYYRTK